MARIKVEEYEFRKFCQAAEKKMNPERAARIEEFAKLAKDTNAAPTSKDITPELLTKIHTAIEDQFENSVTKFCEKHDFEAVSVWQILDGRRKTVSAGVKKVLKALKIKHP